jgi:hypothetical protein
MNVLQQGDLHSHRMLRACDCMIEELSRLQHLVSVPSSVTVRPEIILRLITELDCPICLHIDHAASQSNDSIQRLNKISFPAIGRLRNQGTQEHCKTGLFNKPRTSKVSCESCRTKSSCAARLGMRRSRGRTSTSHVLDAASLPSWPRSAIGSSL